LSCGLIPGFLSIRWQGTDEKAMFPYTQTIISRVRFEVFTAVTMKNGVFWVVTPCGSCKNPEDTILYNIPAYDTVNCGVWVKYCCPNVEAAWLFEMLPSTDQAARW
jgi:hypothetical protein